MKYGATMCADILVMNRTLNESTRKRQILDHIAELKSCKRCPAMIGPVVAGQPVKSSIYLVGQAPGTREGEFGKPFAWTAGKTLFKWFAQTGIEEETVRSRIYFAAVCRCFPGKAPKGGDRVPSKEEIENCSGWMRNEINMLKPRLVVPVGRLAIECFLPKAPLNTIVGTRIQTEAFEQSFDLIALPHPSGASTWFKKDPGKSLLSAALALLKKHPAWKETFS